MVYLYLRILVQVVAESLPISSSGHAQLLDEWWFYSVGENPRVLFYPGLIEQCIDPCLHFFTLIIIFMYLIKRVTYTIIKDDFCWSLVSVVVKTVAIVDGVTVMFYVMRSLGWYPSVPLWVGFMMTSFSLYSLRYRSLTVTQRSWQHVGVIDACLLGVVQGCALLPGCSRFGLVYVVASWRGFSSISAFVLSWLVHVPLMGAAIAKSMLWVLMHPESHSNLVAIIIDSYIAVLIIMATMLGYGAFVYAVMTAHRKRLYIFSFYMILPVLFSLGLWMLRYHNTNNTLFFHF